MTAPTQTTARFVWHDLMSRDPEKAKAFYTELFGWKIQIKDMGEFGEYDMLMAGATPIGGIVGLSIVGLAFWIHDRSRATDRLTTS